MSSEIEEHTPSPMELVELAISNPVAIFKTGSSDAFLAGLKEKISSIIIDPTTHKGREDIRSEAFKLVKIRTGLVKAANSLTADMKAQVSTLNNRRDDLESNLQALEDEFRRPLTEFEDREKNRVKAHEEEISQIDALDKFIEMLPTADQLKERIEALDQIPARSWEEFEPKATAVTNRVRSYLNTALAQRVKADQDAEDLARLRQKEADDAEKARTDAIAAEAAEKAKKQAEDEAKVELVWIEAQRDNAEFDTKAEKQRAEAAEFAAMYAEANAENHRIDRVAQEEIRTWHALHDDAERENERFNEAQVRKWLDLIAEAEAENHRIDSVALAVQAEKDRVAQVEADKKAADDKRAENQAHKKKINNEILAAFLGYISPALSPEDCAKELIAAIAQGKVCHVSIKY